MKRLVQGIDFTDDAFAIDLIDKVGYGGAYVSQKHTAKNFRREVYYPKYFNRRQRIAFERDDGKSLNEKLNAKVREIIEEEEKNERH